MRILRRAAVVILLGLTLGTPWAEAYPRRLAASTSQHFLDYLGGLLTSLWLKGGCIMDPNGRCAQSLRADTGCTMDPDGRCAPGAQVQSTDEGCTMDPNGRCAPGH